MNRDEDDSETMAKEKPNYHQIFVNFFHLGSRIDQLFV